VGLAAPLVALAMAAVTGVLLIADLTQPWRFLYIFTMPQWGSWLVRGSYVLLAFGGVGSAWLLAGLVDSPGAIRALAVPGIVLGAGAAGYTAWLFGQCEGRDLWQTPLMLPVLLAQAITAGAAGLALPAALLGAPDGVDAILAWCLAGGALAQAALVAIELGSHGTTHVALATAALTRGAYRGRFRLGVVAGMVAPAALGIAAAVGASPWLTVAGGAVALVGLAAYEDGFVRAGQSVPLS
jgi:formate-dependent nitrite reductase membrane component NrfD